MSKYIQYQKQHLSAPNKDKFSTTEPAVQSTLSEAESAWDSVNDIAADRERWGTPSPPQIYRAYDRPMSFQLFSIFSSDAELVWVTGYQLKWFRHVTGDDTKHWNHALLFDHDPTVAWHFSLKYALSGYMMKCKVARSQGDE
eukprot:6806159-Pyramimonas_sp.AAC.1